MSNYKNFYENTNTNSYTKIHSAENHPANGMINNFIKTNNLNGKKCLEIGSNIGLFQNHVIDYTGIDITDSLKKNYTKPYFIVNEDGTYPFDDNTFDAIWTRAVHEHIPDLQQSLLEMKRVLKPNGLVLFAPAWQCRSWAAEGYEVRPYSDFNFLGKLIKASIPIRDTVAFRLSYIMPKRIFRHLLFIFGYKYKKIRYKTLKPNYDTFWTADSDAINSIDHHDAILWFESNVFKFLSDPLHLKAFLIKNSELILKKL